MRLLTLCVVLGVALTVSLASPLKSIVTDESSSSESSESIGYKTESKIIVKDPEQEDSLQSAESESNNIIKDKEDSSSESEEDPGVARVKDEAKEVESSEDEEDNIVNEERRFLVVIDDDDVLNIKNDNTKVKRSFRDAEYMSSANNHLKVKDEGSIKYEKYLKLKRVRRTAPKDDTSEENSSEEKRNNHSSHKSHTKSANEGHNHSPHLGHEHSEIPAAKVPATAPEESAPRPEDLLKAESARRRRSAESSEENSSEEKAHKGHDHSGHASHDHSSHTGHEHSEIPAAKVPATAPEESAPRPEDLIKAESARRRRSAESSEENSSEEKAHKGHDHSGHAGHDHSTHAGHEHSEIPAAKVPATAPEESAPRPEDLIKAESARRRRSAGSSEENSSEEKVAKNSHCSHHHSSHGGHKGHDHSTHVDHEGHDHSGHAGHDHSTHLDHEHSEIPAAKVLATAPEEDIVIAAKSDTSPEERAPKPEQSSRRRRSAKSSEENSSEEKPSENDHSGHAGHDHSTHLGHEHSEIPAAKVPATAPEESAPRPEDRITANSARRRRSAGSSEENSNEEDSIEIRRKRNVDLSIPVSSDESIDQDLNEVFIYKTEKQLSEENFKEEPLKNSKYFIIGDKVSINEAEKTMEVTSTDEDYARGCGGNNDSSDDSKDYNETI